MSETPRAERIEVADPLQAFQDLMPFRVQDILLVSSLYESFTIQEDGRLDALLLDSFLGMQFEQAPRLHHETFAAAALERVRAERRFNLLLTSPDPGDMDATRLAASLREAGLDVPVVVLAFDNEQRKQFAARDLSGIDRLYLWHGDARILVAIVKAVEDARNAAHDTAAVGVPVILVVEDNVRYYSLFLPQIYATLIRQSARVLPESINASHRAVRLRARPKILLATTFEEAWALFERYKPWVLGLISDVEFPRGGASTPEAGFDLARMARTAIPDLPVLLHSSRETFAARARAMGATFLRKYSPTLLADLERFMVDHFAFGDFVFRNPDGVEVGRAADLKQLEAQLETVPAASIGFHGERNHFSRWFTARTEFSLARRLRPRQVSDFPSLEGLRHDLMGAIRDYRREQSEALVADFDPHTFEPETAFFARIGTGSLGGKARGLAFVRYLINYHGLGSRIPGVKIAVPPALVLATGCFERFLAANGLWEAALAGGDDRGLEARFLEAPLPGDVTAALAAFVERVRWPLAVRSSSLLEDSQFLPFTGVYDTYMLANEAESSAERLAALSAAIRKVYASTFRERTRAYVHGTPVRVEEERMAVLIQRVVGGRHGNRYYPDFSGVARSHDFYPAPGARAEDGVATVALGLGRAVVEGGQCLSFSPRYPRHIPHFSAVGDILQHSQREFWALGMKGSDPAGADTMRESPYGLEVAEADGTLAAVGSTYSPENQAIYDGLSRAGARLVTFAPVLKHELFPLADIIALLLEVGAHGMNRAAEIEFAVRLSVDGEPHEFGFLQMRPLALATGDVEIDVDGIPDDQIICRSPRVLGNGRIDDIHDVVVVDFHRFDRSQSRAAAREVARLNAELLAAERPYLLIGVGRWGSTDPWLGIPVHWEQIAGARVIVETGFRDLRVTPSQGSHFFQNLTSFQVGYFTVNPEAGEGSVDWDWLAAHPVLREAGSVRLLRFEEPVVVLMNGRLSRGVILKPGGGASES